MNCRPAGKPIRTVHRTDAQRLGGVLAFIREQVEQGRQIYVVYPLIEESAQLDHKDLMDGYERPHPTLSLLQTFGSASFTAA